MKFRRKLAAFTAACVLGTASFTGMEAEAAEIPEYMRSVTYFGDEWPINYWNSEDKNMEENMARIAADGFNSPILVIPWREFQPSEVGSYFNERAFARLDQVMDCAERHGLGVVLRLGYVWDYLGATETPKRFAAITKDDGPERKLWLEYSKRCMKRRRPMKTSGAASLPGRISGTIRKIWAATWPCPAGSVWQRTAATRRTWRKITPWTR